MKKKILLLSIIFFLIICFYPEKYKDYYVKKYPIINEEYDSLINTSIINRNKKVILLHIDYTDVSDIFQNEILILSDLKEGYRGNFNETIKIDVDNASSLSIYFIDKKNNKAYSWWPMNDDTYFNLEKNKEAYIKLYKDGHFNLKYNKYIPYCMSRYYNR